MAAISIRRKEPCWVDRRRRRSAIRCSATRTEDEKRRRPVLWAGPVLASDRLLIAGSTGELLALSPYTGEVLGKLLIGSPVRLGPVVANRTIYVLTDTGRLIALR